MAMSDEDKGRIERAAEVLGVGNTHMAAMARAVLDQEARLAAIELRNVQTVNATQGRVEEPATGAEDDKAKSAKKK